MVYVKPILDQEITLLIQNNEHLYKANQELKQLLRAAVIAVETEQVYSFDWKEWAQKVKNSSK